MAAWGQKRYDDRARMEQRPYTQASAVVQSNEPLKRVELDALVFLQIMKHCRQNAPQIVTGQLLGLDSEDVLQVTHCFASCIDEGEHYQIEMNKKLREVNVDSNSVGWYQTTHLGRYFTRDAIDAQYEHQTEYPRSVFVVYDALQSAVGKPSFKALQLTPSFMEAYGRSNEVGRLAMADFPSDKMFLEIPIVMSSSLVVENFLVDWSMADQFSTTSQIGTLDVDNQHFLEKNCQLVLESLGELAEEQQKLIMFERQQARKGEGKGMEKGKFNRNMPPPRHLDTMILSQQIQKHCKAINGFAEDSFGKIYLMSNKPSRNT